MVCDKCKERQASILVEQNINGESRKMHLCPQCAASFTVPISFNGLFQDFLNIMEPFNLERTNAVKEGPVCRECGLSYNEFKKTGKLGCSHCYEAFDKEISLVFDKIQSNVSHSGKIPKKLGGDFVRAVRGYREELKKAIENEEYEKAASLRDRIRAVEKEISLREEENK